MPQLPIYTAPVGDAPIFGGRRAEGSDFSVADLSGIGRTVREAAGAFAAQTEEDEARRALIASTEIRAKYAKALDDAAVSGAPLAPLQEAMVAELSKVGESFRTKRGVDSLAMYTANTNLMFNEQSNAIAVRRASATARLEGSKFLNSTAAIIQRNPAYLATAEKDAEAFGLTLTGISPEARAEIVDGLKKELNQATAIALTRLDPEGTKKRLEDGEFNLTPDQRNVALNKADSEIRAKKAEEAYQRSERDRQEREANEAAYDTHLKAILDGGKGKSLRRAIMDDPALKPSTREHLIEMMEQRAKAGAGEERRSNQSVLRDLWSQAASGQIFTNDAIVAAARRGDLNVRDASWLSSVVMQQRDSSGATFNQRLGNRMRVVESALRARPDYPALAATGKADAIQIEMITQVEKRANDLRKEGKSPDALFDPDSKDYFFTPNRVKQVAEDIERRMAPQVPRVTTREEYDALPPGAQYQDANGQIAIKRGSSGAGTRTMTGRIGGQ